MGATVSYGKTGTIRRGSRGGVAGEKDAQVGDFGPSVQGVKDLLARELGIASGGATSEAKAGAGHGEREGACSYCSVF